MEQLYSFFNHFKISFPLETCIPCRSLLNMCSSDYTFPPYFFIFPSLLISFHICWNLDFKASRAVWATFCSQGPWRQRNTCMVHPWLEPASRERDYFDPSPKYFSIRSSLPPCLCLNSHLPLEFKLEEGEQRWKSCKKSDTQTLPLHFSTFKNTCDVLSVSRHSW